MGDLARQGKKYPSSAGIEVTTSGFDRPFLYRLNYEARWEQVVGDEIYKNQLDRLHPTK